MCNDIDININICGIYGVYRNEISCCWSELACRSVDKCVTANSIYTFILSTLVDLTTAAVYSGAASQASPFIGLLGSK